MEGATQIDQYDLMRERIRSFQSRGINFVNASNRAQMPQPLLTEAELLFLQFASKSSRHYLEWGSGASTILVAPFSRNAFSIENHQEWCDQMLRNKFVSFWIQTRLLQYYCVDTGPTNLFGHPVDLTNKARLSKYLDVVDSFQIDKFDMVLIDGRFRMACAVKVLPYVTKSSLVLIHDWMERKDNFRQILNFYDLDQVIDTLAVLIPKQEKWKQHALQESIDIFMNYP